MDVNFEEAEYYVKDLISLQVELLIKDANNVINRRNPNLSLIVSGGQAIEKYFPNSPPLRTHDYDLKVVVPSEIQATPTILQNMYYVGKTVGEIFNQRLNSYLLPLLNKIRKVLLNKYKVDIVLSRNNNIFRYNEISKALTGITLTLTDINRRRVRASPIIDIYVVNPSTLYHYDTFTVKGDNPILKEEAGKYYIPLNYINGVPYATIGYLIWDTLRMIKYTQERGLEKYKRYKDKLDSIISSLNNPEQRLSCDSMKDFITTCETRFESPCSIGDKTFNNKQDLIQFGINEGVLNPDPKFLSKLEIYNMFSLCDAIKRSLR